MKTFYLYLCHYGREKKTTGNNDLERITTCVRSRPAVPKDTHKNNPAIRTGDGGISQS